MKIFFLFIITALMTSQNVESSELSLLVAQVQKNTAEYHQVNEKRGYAVIGEFKIKLNELKKSLQETFPQNKITTVYVENIFDPFILDDSLLSTNLYERILVKFNADKKMFVCVSYLKSYSDKSKVLTLEPCKLLGYGIGAEVLNKETISMNANSILELVSEKRVMRIDSQLAFDLEVLERRMALALSENISEKIELHIQSVKYLSFMSEYSEYMGTLPILKLNMTIEGVSVSCAMSVANIQDKRKFSIEVSGCETENSNLNDIQVSKSSGAKDDESLLLPRAWGILGDD